jgi:hypothetical protein
MKNFQRRTSLNGFEKYILLLQKKLKRIQIHINPRLKNFKKTLKMEMKNLFLYGKRLERFVYRILNIFLMNFE